VHNIRPRRPATAAAVAGALIPSKPIRVSIFSVSWWTRDSGHDVYRRGQ